jgi:hypothetical protein
LRESVKERARMKERGKDKRETEESKIFQLCIYLRRRYNKKSLKNIEIGLFLKSPH